MSYRAFDGYTSTQTASGVDGYSFTVRAQSATGTGTVGGDLILGAGNGTTRDGYVRLFAGDIEQARAVEGKFQFLTGQRVKVNTVSSTPFNILDGYYVVIVDTTAIGGPSTINLPASPVVGDIYHVKVLGTASTNNVTINGNGHNIDASATLVINTNYANTMLLYNGTTWSVL